MVEGFTAKALYCSLGNPAYISQQSPEILSELLDSSRWD
jgi:hypothetical protein